MRWAFMVLHAPDVPSDRELTLPVAGGAPGQPGALFLARQIQSNTLARGLSTKERHQGKRQRANVPGRA